MKFKSINGDTFEISIVGWEYPNEDWLMVKVKGTESGSSWDGVDPSLMYEEAVELAEWLASLNVNVDSELLFLEPELEFKYGSGKLTIYLEWKLRPPWEPSDVNSKEKFGLSFDIAEPELRKQAASWKAEVDHVYKNRKAI